MLALGSSFLAALAQVKCSQCCAWLPHASAVSVMHSAVTAVESAMLNLRQMHCVLCLWLFSQAKKRVEWLLLVDIEYESLLAY